MFFYIEDIKDNNVGFFGITISKIIQMCNGGWGDLFSLTSQCMKVQLFYYSPWISGFIGMIFLVKSGPYRGYSGYGGAGSHNRRMRPKTKKRLIIVIVIGVLVLVGIFLYANYDITIANQKIDDIIPVESIKKTINEISEKIPVKIEKRP